MPEPKRRGGLHSARQGWGSGWTPEDEQDQRRKVVPRGTILGPLYMSITGKQKAWIEEEARRRGIPPSWMVVEVLAAGIETYSLRGAPDGGAVVDWEAV